MRPGEEEGRREGTCTPGFGGEAGRAPQGGGWRREGAGDPAGCSGNFPGDTGDTKAVRGAPGVPARCSPVYASPGHSTLLTICATLSRAPWVRGYTRSSSPSEGWPGPGAPPLLHVVRMSPDPCDIAGAQTGRPPPGPRDLWPVKLRRDGAGPQGRGARVPLPSCGGTQRGRAGEQMPRKLLPTRLAEVGLVWAGNRTPGALASPRSAPPRSQLVTSLQGFFCVGAAAPGC